MARPFGVPSAFSIHPRLNIPIFSIHQQLQLQTTFTSSSTSSSLPLGKDLKRKHHHQRLSSATAPRLRLQSFFTTRPRTLLTTNPSHSFSIINWKLPESLYQPQQVRNMTTPSNLDEKVVIRELTSGVTTLSIPFLRFDKIKFGSRATIVQLQNGLAVFSPIPITPAVSTHIQSLGLPVTYLIAPDVEHHMSLSAWAAEYPTAHIIAPEGLPEKRAQQNATNKAVTILNFGTVFTVKDKKSEEGIKVTPEFDSQFHFELVDAHPNKELVFVHKASKTLITADLLFNLPAHEQYSKSGESPTTGIFTKLFTALNNTHGNAIWQKRLAWYVFSKADRPGFNASIQRINSWDFVNIVPSHGDSIVGDGKQIFEKVFGWHLTGKK